MFRRIHHNWNIHNNEDGLNKKNIIIVDKIADKMMIWLILAKGD